MEVRIRPLYLINNELSTTDKTKLLSKRNGKVLNPIVYLLDIGHEFTNILRRRDKEARRGSHIYFLVKITMEESIVDIKLF